MIGLTELYERYCTDNDDVLEAAISNLPPTLRSECEQYRRQHREDLLMLMQSLKKLSLVQEHNELCLLEESGYLFYTSLAKAMFLYGAQTLQKEYERDLKP